MERLKGWAQTLTAVAGAAGLVGALLWSLWIEPRVRSIAEDTASRIEGKTQYQIAQLAGAMASGDTSLAGFMARYGVPIGAPGR